ncbi:MAG: M28 family peptidase [Anaerolineae bacterium]
MNASQAGRRLPTLTRALVILLILCGLLGSCAVAPPTPLVFDGEQAYAWVVEQCDLGYRIPGTEAHRKAGDLIIETLESHDWQVMEQRFDYQGTEVRNLLASKGDGPALMLGAHYDTRPAADQEDPSVPVMGANDGASGVAVLLELARVLDIDSTGHRLYLAFFDAEDSGYLNGWDWIVGSTHMAENWGAQGEPPLTAMVLFDMIGDRDLQVYYEGNSDPELSREIWQVAAELGYDDRIIPQLKHRMLDDHIPFVNQGIPAIDMIDFDYPYWHTTQDTPDKVAPESLAVIGDTLETWLESLGGR